MFSIILPVYNEKENIQIIIPLIFQNLNFVECEIIIVDDDSKDGTDKVSEELKNRFKNLKYLNRKNNGRSLGASVADGIKASKYENIILMDCDLSHSVEDLIKLVNLKQNNDYDLICCSRFKNNNTTILSLRYQLSKIYNHILKPFISSKVLDNLSGFFLLKKNLLDDLNFDNIFYGYGDYYFRLIYYLQKRKDLKIYEMSFTWVDRQYGKSKTKFLNIFLRYTYEAIKLRLKNLI